jgi:hypothetical protein
VSSAAAGSFTVCAVTFSDWLEKLWWIRSFGNTTGCSFSILSKNSFFYYYKSIYQTSLK